MTSVLARGDAAVARPPRHLTSALEFKFAENVVNMRFRGRETDIETPGDFLVAKIRADEPDDLHLSRGQFGCLLRHA
jgi:hypothetical protein